MSEPRIVPDFPDYRVFPDGIVQSCKGGEWRTLSPGRYYATADGNPYLKVTLRNAGGSRSANVHSLVLTLFVGPRPPGMQCRHLNGDPSDNRVENLRWGTPKENHADMAAHGTRRPPRGERSGSARLSDEFVIRLRKEYAAGASGRELAAKYGLPKNTVQSAATGLTWGHLPVVSRPPRHRSPLTAAEKATALGLLASGLTQKEVAARLRIDQSSISRAVNGVIRRRGVAR